MEQLISGFGLPLLVSVAIALGSQFVSNSTDSEFLKKNLEATERLTTAVSNLETKVAVILDRQERAKDGR